jgi:hypothetical protein
MNNKRKMLVTCFLVVTFATPAFAWMGNWQGNSGTNRPVLSAEQQQQVQQFENSYGKDLEELESQLNAKQAELLAARSNDATTVGQLNKLERELHNQERTYWTKLDQANLEVSKVAGGGYGSWFACDYRGCDHNYGRHGMMRGGMMTDRRDMHNGRNGSCCW